MERDLKKLISEMTLEEKAGLCSGADGWHTKAVERLGIPSAMMSDGPHGLRKQSEGVDNLGRQESIVAVCFPAACATASSFDTQLIRDMGDALGQECRAEDLSILLGPAVNIKRSPLCGRNFEYLSEDPYLAGKMAAAYIRGVQKWDVATSIKHFAANSQEYNRMSCSSNVSERTLREIYLPAFEEAVKTAQPKTVMCSYNKVNGVYASENEHLLTEILRNEWGFDGFVMSDWGAVNDRVKGVKAGLELEMPSFNGMNDAKIVAAVRNGTLDEAVLDRAVERILKIVFSYVDHPHPEAVFDRDADHEKAVQIETECAVLLENNGVLPLKREQKIAYIGEFAKKPRFQGGGSSHIHSSKVDSAWDSAIRKNRDVRYAKGFSFDRDEEDAAAFSEAVEAAREADVAVIFAGLPEIMESEGYDRTTMKMPACQDKLIAAVAAVQKNTVVVLHNGSPVECPWADSVAAVLEMYLGGQGVGEACDRLLWGEENPSGHLAETFPFHLEDNPSFLNFPGNGKCVNYAEGVFIGYRYYDTKKMPVRWAFGHGLSYTDFSYSNLRLSEASLTDQGCLSVSVDVSNVGSRAGKEVIQLYIRDENGTADRPVKELKGFTKIMLQPGETKTVHFEITARDLSFYHEELKDWYAPSGTYGVLIGRACDDIRLEARFSFATEKLLPLEIDSSTTVGELISDPRTRGIIRRALKAAPADSPFKLEEDNQETANSDADQMMMHSMLMALPLKAMLSFGIITETNMEQMVNALRDGM